MALPEAPEVARAMLARLGPKAMATLESMLDDPKLSAKDRLSVIDMIMKRYMPEPKVDSAAGARRPTVMLTATATDVSALMSRAHQRIAAQPEPVELIDAEPAIDADDEQHSPNSRPASRTAR